MNMATQEKDSKPATTTMAAAATGPQLRLLVDKRSRRVLYAEARKDAVDFLLGLLRVPAGLAARLITKHDGSTPGSLGTLYTGARSLDDAFFLSVASPADRDELLSPNLRSAALPLLGETPPAPPPPPPQKRFYRCAAYTIPCRGNPTNVTDVAGAACPSCRQPMSVEMRWAPGDSYGKLEQAQAQEIWEGGYVKPVVTYLVMDDLTITPMSTISAIMLLNKFGVKDVAALEERAVDLVVEKGVKLLKALMESKTALTDVFMEESSGVSIDLPRNTQ